MNLTLTTPNQPSAQGKSAAPAAAQAAGDAILPMTADAAGAAPANDGAQAAPAQPALAFAQWLGLEQIALGTLEPATSVPPAALPEADIPADEQQASADAPLLGAMAMSMPLMPVAQATLAAVVAALPGVPGAKGSAPAAVTDTDNDTGTNVGTATTAPAGTTTARREGRAEPAAAPALPLAAAPVQAASSVPSAPVALAAEMSTAQGEAAQDQAPPLERSAAPTTGIATQTAAAPQRTLEAVTLSGPPTAWRQTLQEALGERLQLQVGKNAEQAVIRLEPPMLGRVEIAIRHSAGSLEVHISATHGEVLRQLQSVSENLRNDLAQRQFSDVSVNVAPAPRAANGAPMFAGGDGRGRQQDGRGQDQDPGNALAEANTGTSPFSLNGRGQGRSHS